MSASHRRRASCRPGSAALLALAWLALACGGREPSVQEGQRAGLLRFEVRDEATGRLIPCKLTVLGLGGTPDPELGSPAGGSEQDGLTLAANRVHSHAGEGSLRLPSGTYEVHASRGIEWDVAVRRVEIGPGGARLDATLSHVVDVDGWLSVDLHVHSAASHDSRVPLRSRVRQLAAEGVGIVASMDHDVVTDYAPIVDELGLGAELATARGVEIATDAWGHFGVFPVPADFAPALDGDGVAWRGLDPGRLLAELRRRARDALITVHHARLRDTGYFARAGFDPAADQSASDFSRDFDALEVWNGAAKDEGEQVERAMQDWFGLLDHGHAVTATGGSDSHRLAVNAGGYPRNYVRVDRPLGSSVTSARDVASALRRGQAFFTTGPFVEASIAGRTFGETVSLVEPEFELELQVQAAPWIDVRRVVVHVGGKPGPVLAVDEGAEPVRLRTRIPLRATADTYVVVEVLGERPLWPVVGDLRRDRVLPAAVTNAIFVDADGNGRFDAPLALRGHAPPGGEAARRSLPGAPSPPGR